MPKLRRPSWWLAAALIAASCGDSGPAERDPDGSLGTPSTPVPRGGPDGAAAPVTPTDTGPWVAETPPAAEQPNPHPWVNGASRGGSQGSGAPILVNVRTARQDGYDRIVFEFDTHVPEWRTEYVDRPQYECGSGDAVRLEGDGWLQVNFEGAHAHTEEGRATAAPRHVADPAGANLRELRRICDFEAQVQYVLGVASPKRYRAFQLASPARLVVDIQQ